MHYVGTIIQRVWTDEQLGRPAARRHHRRPAAVPGSDRRRTSPGRSQRD